ncbi:hypothetical protein JL475_28615 [Streptomyces sp. M2CJ-2]|nr:hypothetical protein [Streptomyces sp. M2CJ-2]MBL3669878.1 hypothetical protein [Streptomyces sp. M2CJ-2]
MHHQEDSRQETEETGHRTDRALPVSESHPNDEDEWLLEPHIVRGLD